ncbi:bifunctional proline dehydrogenase/L-glutamate gamma-semialdehyde dehydrogenase [bacterium]|nr:bifunctional proline dehydrogenase/L-glutamate gamma-semialdehyde dehydrogenase [bacterium]
MNFYQLLENAKEYIELPKKWKLTHEEKEKGAIELASLIIHMALTLQSPEDQLVIKKRASLLRNKQSILFFTDLADQFFRAVSPKRATSQIKYLISKHGIPGGLTASDQLKMFGFLIFGRFFPSFATKYTSSSLEKEFHEYMLPGKKDPLAKALHGLSRYGISANISYLGETVIGHKSAEDFLASIITLIETPTIDCVSLKLSSLYPNLHPLKGPSQKSLLMSRLGMIFEVAQSHSTFVYLDMEFFDDLFLTIDVFQTILDEPRFKSLYAGIVLQSYIPNSFGIQKDLTEWAQERVKMGGSPIKIRLVKGANLRMEQIIASQSDWSQAPYSEKIDTDANFKKMILYACRPQNAHSAHIGIGSHNVFDISFALLERAQHGVEQYVSFEMLYGMGTHVRKVVQMLVDDVLLYCPISHPGHTHYSIAYLLRRLDENMSPENFLRHLYTIRPGTPQWTQEVERFISSFSATREVSQESHRLQNRVTESPIGLTEDSPFTNEPDTDWVLPHNVAWANDLLASNPVSTNDTVQWASDSDINTTIGILSEPCSSAESDSVKDRSALLGKMAMTLRNHRKELIRLIQHTVHKSVLEADAEVSEAIDFLEYYRRQYLTLSNDPNLTLTPIGLTCVIPPWNFPCSIPVGGIAAALISGNPVLLKPAPEAASIGQYLVHLFHQAGVPQTALQCVTCKDEQATTIIKHPSVKQLVFTGSNDTAHCLQLLRPTMPIIAETGGKNTVIITEMSDWEQAIQYTIQSAFGFSGQKCSAASLMICEKNVYESPFFKSLLIDAVKSLDCGPSSELHNKIVPLIGPPNERIQQLLQSLHPKEEWLIRPSLLSETLLSPGLIWNVQPGSNFFKTEVFGPILGICCADDLTHAIDIANRSSYGLTAGLHSLDEREQSKWQSQIQAGNLYINRPSTGAIVNRQPFGGIKGSSLGWGLKAGGPNYLLQFSHIEGASDSTLPAIKLSDRTQQFLSHTAVISLNISELPHLANNYEKWASNFAKPTHLDTLLGQDNILEYRLRTGIIYRHHASDTLDHIAQFCLASISTNAPIHIMLSRDTSPKVGAFFTDIIALLPKGSRLDIFTQELFLTHLRQLSVPSLVRFLSPPSDSDARDIIHTRQQMLISSCNANGAIECLRFYQEISMSRDTHRYGNLGHPKVDCNS